MSYCKTCEKYYSEMLPDCPECFDFKKADAKMNGKWWERLSDELDEKASWYLDGAETYRKIRHYDHADDCLNIASFYANASREVLDRGRKESGTKNEPS